MDGRSVRRNDQVVADQSVPRPLKIALFMELRHVLPDRTTENTLPYEDHLRQAFVLDQAYEALRERIQIR